MAKKEDMSLAEAANLCKKLEHEYRVFENAAVAAKTVLTAFNEVDTYRKGAAKAKDELSGLQGEISERMTEARILGQEIVRSKEVLETTKTAVAGLEASIVNMEPKLERGLATVETKLNVARANSLKTLETAKEAKAKEVSREINGLEARRNKLQTAVDGLTRDRDELKSKVEAALAQMKA